MEGWIKIHRKILDWEWYSDNNVKVVFLHLLLKANHKEKAWQGKIIKEGQLVTSLSNLSKELKLTIKQIRIALGKLKETNEIDVKGQSKYSLITITKYSDYQFLEYEKGQTKDTQKGIQEGKQRATNNNDNNIFNYFISNYIVKLDGKDFGEKIKIKGQMRRDPKWIELTREEQWDLIGR